MKQLFMKFSYRYKNKKYLLSIVLLLSVITIVFSQKKPISTGIIIDSIAILNSTETYALYLPKKFDEKKLTSIVFIFEPAARGKTGIRPFIKSAEKYNYVLICSNNSKNGPMEINFEITNRLFNSVFETYNIDKNLIYAAGFSGGSRFATTIAVLTKQIQGVVACGAGFSPNNNHIPMSKESFSYAGLVGDRDMNYQEMFTVKGWLDRFQIANEIFIYDDNHRWPPPNQLLKAFEWLELEAYKKNIKQVDKIFLKESYQNSYKNAKTLENDNKIEQSVWEYERIQKNYSRYYILDSIKKKVSELKSRKNYRKTKKHQLEVKNIEAKIRKKISKRFRKELTAKKKPNSYTWWKKELKKLNDTYLKSKNILFKKMGERIIYASYAMSIEAANNQLRNRNIVNALYCHNLVALIIPEKPFPYFLLAKDYALLNDDENVFKNLEIAISKGLVSKNLLLKTTAFLKYKNSEQFLAILNLLNK